MSARRSPATAVAVCAALTTWLVVASWSRLLQDVEGLPRLLLVVVALVTATGIGLRRLGLDWPFAFAGQVLVALLVLQAQLGTSWLPGPESGRAAARALMRALASAHENPSPVAEDVPSIVPVLLAGGVAVHLVVDLVAASLHRTLAASLPLLAAWVLPVSVLGSAPPWPLFAVAATAWLLLLAADQTTERMRWGRVISAPWVEALGPGRATVAIGGTALVAAMLLPTVLPHRGAVTLPGTGPAPGDVVRLTDPVADLQRNLTRGDDIGLLRITVPRGAAAPRYVRVSVLDEYVADAWRSGPRSWPEGNGTTGAWPRVPALDLPGERVPWRVEVSKAFASTWLPVPRWATSVVAGKDWRFDQEHLDVHRAGSRGTTAGLTYDAVEYRPELGSARLADAPHADRLGTDATLPADRPAWLHELAVRITRGADTDYAKAVALQEFFQKNYRYSTDPSPATGIEALHAFLTEDSARVGYCEQFAASMALLARELDLPARISVGFLRPERVRGSTWEFSAHDLHAWPEIWFSGVGWVGFEPTPTSHTGTVPPWSRTPREAQPSTSASPSAAPSAAPRPQDRNPDAGAATTGDDGPGWFVPAVAGGLGLLLLGAWLPRLVRARQRARRLGTDSTEEWWAELRASALDLGVAWPEGRSPRATARRVSAELADGEHDARQALERLVSAVERDRYAVTGGGDATARDVQACVRALQEGRPRRTLRRAAWWPRSVTGSVLRT